MLERLDILKYKGYDIKEIIDVGAHLGKFALKCRELWPNSNIQMFEANPNSEDTLKTLNIPYTIALLTDEIGKEYSYYLTKKWLLSSGNSIYKENTEDFDDSNLIEYKLISNTLDNLLSNVNKIDLLKLDTQGSELNILKGAKNVIEKTRFILLECSVYEYNKGGCLIGDIFDFMNKNKFRLLDIVELNYLDDITLNQVDLLFEKIK